MGLREAIGVKTSFSLSRQIVLLSLFLYGSVLSSRIVITHSLCRGLEWMYGPTMSLIGWQDQCDLVYPLLKSNLKKKKDHMVIIYCLVSHFWQALRSFFTTLLGI